MKKILAIFFIVALTAMLFACGGKNNNNNGSGSGNGAVGDAITDMSDIIDDLMPGTNSTRRTTEINTDTPTLPEDTNSTAGTNEAVPPSTGGGTTVR